MSDESPTPPATAAPAKDASADVTSAPADAAAGTPERRPVWVGLDQPFAVGFAVTLGGLAAILLGLAVSNLATVIIYVSFALFAALGLDPIVRALERKGVRRVWGMVIVYVGFLLVIAGVMLLIMPTVISQVAQFIRDIPTMINDFEKSDAFGWMQTNFGDQIGTILNDVENSRVGCEVEHAAHLQVPVLNLVLVVPLGRCLLHQFVEIMPICCCLFAIKDLDRVHKAVSVVPRHLLVGQVAS